MPASRSSNCEPNSATPISLRLRGSSSLFRASTVSKNAACAVSPPAAKAANILSELRPRPLKASALLSLPSFALMLNSLTASATLSMLNRPASAPSTREPMNWSALRPRAANCARVFVQGVEQVAVFVRAVLCAGGD